MPKPGIFQFLHHIFSGASHTLPIWFSAQSRVVTESSNLSWQLGRLGCCWIETPQQRHVCYLHLPQASASGLQRHNLMLKQVPACSSPPHPLTQPRLVVLTGLLSDHKEGRGRKRGLHLLWSRSLQRLSHERITFIPGEPLDRFQRLEALPVILKPSPPADVVAHDWPRQGC